MTRMLSEYETEWEFESEDESEFEDEYEFESEWESEGEWEGEAESEEFFRRIASLARRAAASPTLRRVGLAAARTALGGLGNVGAAVGGAPGSRGASVGSHVGTALGGILTDMLPQREMEWESEGEWEEEGEYEVNPVSAVYRDVRNPGPANPVRRVYPDALMEHLGHAAAEAETEAESEAFVGALIPVAARVLPRVAPALLRAAPQLVQGVTSVARTLRRNPATRPLVRMLPTIVRRTAANLAQQVGQGRPISAQQAVQTLARQTARVLSSPQQVTRAWQRARAVDRRYHQAAQTGGRAAAAARAISRRAAGATAGAAAPGGMPGMRSGAARGVAGRAPGGRCTCRCRG